MSASQFGGLTLSGRTAVYPVVGHPIGQVRSPSSVTEVFVRLGQNAIVVPMSVETGELPEVLGALARVGNVHGVLITIPHKHAAFSLCSEVSLRAKAVGAVNVVRKGPSGWIGDNTDGLGFVGALHRKGFDPSGKNAILVGLGGAGSAIALELLESGLDELCIVEVDPERHDRLITGLQRRFGERVYSGGADPRGFDLAVNATPLGMREADAFPFDPTLLSADQWVGCVITEPAISPLIAQARARGCSTVTGIEMFDAQAEVLARFVLADHPEFAAQRHMP